MDKFVTRLSNGGKFGSSANKSPASAKVLGDKNHKIATESIGKKSPKPQPRQQPIIDFYGSGSKSPPSSKSSVETFEVEDISVILPQTSPSHLVPKETPKRESAKEDVVTIEDDSPQISTENNNDDSSPSPVALRQRPAKREATLPPPQIQNLKRVKKSESVEPRSTKRSSKSSSIEKTAVKKAEKPKKAKPERENSEYVVDDIVTHRELQPNVVSYQLIN